MQDPRAASLEEHASKHAARTTGPVPDYSKPVEQIGIQQICRDSNSANTASNSAGLQKQANSCLQSLDILLLHADHLRPNEGGGKGSDPGDASGPSFHQGGCAAASAEAELREAPPDSVLGGCASQKGMQFGNLFSPGSSPVRESRKFEGQGCESSNRGGNVFEDPYQDSKEDAAEGGREAGCGADPVSMPGESKGVVGQGRDGAELVAKEGRGFEVPGDGAEPIGVAGDASACTSNSMRVGGSNSGRGVAAQKCKLLYKLTAVIVHAGVSNSGHYRTYRRAAVVGGPDVWLSVSDEHVSQCSLREVQGCEATLLMYARI